MLPLTKQEMAQLPESLTEVKECCARCGCALGKGSRYIKATIEQMMADGETVLMDYDQRCFCENCAKGGVYVSVKDPKECDG